MEIGGTHGFDQSLDYAIHMKVPRSMLGTKGNEVINSLAAKVSDKGVPVKLGETVNVNVKMLGTISDPQINLDLKESATKLADELKEQATDFAKTKIDSSKQVVKDTLQSLRKQAVSEVSSRLKDQLFGKKDTTTTDSSKNKPENAADRLKESGKGLIENLNPFKKKK